VPGRRRVPQLLRPSRLTRVLEQAAGVRETESICRRPCFFLASGSRLKLMGLMGHNPYPPNPFDNAYHGLGGLEDPCTGLSPTEVPTESSIHIF
jgi:hypothetical protein